VSRLFFGARLGLNGGSRGGFTPSILPDLKLWLAADRISGLVDGDPVTTWADLSGQGNNATQGTGAAKPTYKTNIVNGRPALLFDGVDDFLDVPAPIEALLQTSTKSVFAVVKWVTLVNNTRIFTLANGAAQTRFSLGIISGFNYYLIYTTGSATQSNSIMTGGAAPSTSVAQIFDVTQNGTALAGYVNGTLGNSVNDAGTTAPNTAGTVGSNQGGSLWANVYICEIVAYDTALSASDRARVRRYLGAKYSVAVS
jgi:hypothetical protein